MINFEIIEKNYTVHNEKRVADGYFLGSICGVWDREKSSSEKQSAFQSLIRVRE